MTTKIRSHMDVSPRVGELLIKLAYGWKPAAVPIGATATLAFNTSEVDDLDGQVTVVDDRMRVGAAGSPGNALFRQALGRVDCVTGTLATGVSFEGRLLLSVSDQTKLSRTEAEEAAVFEFADWLVGTPADDVVWVGEVEGNMNTRLGGNLVVEKLREGNLRYGGSQHFRFAGTYTYYLVQSGGTKNRVWYLVLESAGAALNVEVLNREFLVLQFALGRQLRVPSILGVGASGETVAWRRGLGTRRNLWPSVLPPVPLEQDNENWIDQCWAAPLFSRLARYTDQNPQTAVAIVLAMDTYLDTIGVYLEADYLRLHVALEALAYRLMSVAADGEPSIVRDKGDWKRWVKSCESTIRSHANEGYAESLYQKVLTVHRLASGRVVPGAFSSAGLELLPVMETELRSRDVVVHQGLMSDSDDVDPIQRVATVRCMLVALLAKTVGYDGSITGWETGQMGRPLEPRAWWTPSAESIEQADETWYAEKQADETA